MPKIVKICVILLMLLWGVAPASAKINMFPKPRYIPPVSFYDDGGRAYKLTEFKSDLLMAVVWDRSCGPCLKDLKHLGRFVQKTMDKGIEVILISPAKDWKTLGERRAFLRRLGADNMVSYNDRNARFRDGMGISVTPTAILVNKKGEEVGQITGSIEWENPEIVEYMLKLKSEISEKLDESETAN